MQILIYVTLGNFESLSDMNFFPLNLSFYILPSETTPFSISHDRIFFFFWQLGFHLRD